MEVPSNVTSIARSGVADCHSASKWHTGGTTYSRHPTQSQNDELKQSSPRARYVACCQAGPVTNPFCCKRLPPPSPRPRSPRMTRFIFSARELLVSGPDTNHSLMEENIMLVLTRQIGQEIIIDGCIRVTITAIKGDKVRLGITAPPDVRVDREEVHRRLQEFAEPALTATTR